MNSFQGRQFEPIKTADFFFIGTGIDHFGRKAALAEFLINIVGPGISDIRAVFLEGHAKKGKDWPCRYRSWPAEAGSGPGAPQNLTCHC